MALNDGDCVDGDYLIIRGSLAHTVEKGCKAEYTLNRAKQKAKESTGSLIEVFRLVKVYECRVEVREEFKETNYESTSEGNPT